MSPDERASLRELTTACIRAVQIATERSRERYAWAREAWAALDADGQREALAACAQAKGDAIEANTGLIENTVRQWRGVEGDLIARDDLRGAAYEGYLSSMVLYDVNGRTEHSTYAVASMNNAVLRMVYELQPWAQSSNVTRCQNTALSFIDAWKRDHGGQRPTAHEIAAGTKYTVREVEFALSIPVVVSGDGFDEDSEPELERVVSREEEVRREATLVTMAVASVVGEAQARTLIEHAGLPIFDAQIKRAHDAALAV